MCKDVGNTTIMEKRLFFIFIKLVKYKLEEKHIADYLILVEGIECLLNECALYKVNFTWGYWQMPLEEEDKKKTAFTTKLRRWKYNVLPMGITNAAPTFQRNMKAMLSGLLWKKCIIYINNIIVFGSSFNKHLKNIKEVLNWLKKYNMVAKPSKCRFCQEEIKYLGHRVGNRKLMMQKRSN